MNESTRLCSVGVGRSTTLCGERAEGIGVSTWDDVNLAGRVHDLTQPEKIDMAEFHREMDVNYSSFVTLTVEFLSYLMQKQSQTSLI